MTARNSVLTAALLTALGATACGPGAKSSPVSPATSPATPTPPAAQGVAVQVAPAPQALATGASYRFAAAVTGTVDDRVSWSVNEADGGTIDASGTYTAPGRAGSFHVRATSVADARAFGEAAVTVSSPTPVVVTATPSPAAVDACRTLQLTARVTNATNTSVTWSVQEGAAGGTVSASGLYTAPTSPGIYHVVATSVEDPTKTFVVPMTVSQNVLSVAISPASIVLAPGQSRQFTATVTTTCGTSTSTSTVTAPL